MADGVDLQALNDAYRNCIVAGRGLTQDMINWRGVIKNDGQLGNAAAANTLSEIAPGNAATVRDNIGLGSVSTRSVFTSGLINPADYANYMPINQQIVRCSAAFYGAYYPYSEARNIDTEPVGSVGLYSVGNPGTFPPGPGSQSGVFWWIVTQSIYSGSQCVQFATKYKGDGRAYRYGDDNGDGTRKWRSWVTIRDSSNTTTDSNGNLRNASPIYRLSSAPDRLVGDGFKAAGAGVANNEADGVTAERIDVGVYVIRGSLGFAKDDEWPNGYTVPLDANQNRLLHAEIQRDEHGDGTLTVRVYEPAFDPQTGRNIGGAAMDIPADRFIAVRLEMPERDEPIAPAEDSETQEPVQ